MVEWAALIAATSFGLPGLERSLSIEPRDAASLLRIAQVDRLGGFLGRAVEAGLVDCDEATESAITSLWHEQLMTSVAAESVAVRVAIAFEEAGVGWRLTKGAALAHLDYRDPSMRMFGDVDAVVPAGDWIRALDALRDVGFERSAPELRRGFDVRYGKGATLTGPDGHEVDLHLRFAVGRYGYTARMGDVFDESECFRLGDRDIPALIGADRLLHACFHAALGGFRHLRALRDIAQLLLVSNVAWEQTLERAHRWRAEAVVASAVADCWDTFGITTTNGLHTWAVSHQPAGGDRRALEVFRSERPFREQALTSLSVMPWRRWPHYLWCLAGRAIDVGGRPRPLLVRVKAAARARRRRA